jgi:hypothetical protein
MKKYIKPQIQVIPLNCQQCILAGSDVRGTTIYGNINTNSEALGRKNSFDWDEDEDE